ncbi:hypothetical protein TNCV_1054491 [Trichonephila clavipes]|nr:hypothetical protein TNCV_1054491 [Trichonephila clavipes]
MTTKSSYYRPRNHWMDRDSSGGTFWSPLSIYREYSSHNISAQGYSTFFNDGPPAISRAMGTYRATEKGSRGHMRSVSAGWSIAVSAKLVYDRNLRLPGKFLEITKAGIHLSQLVKRLRQHT